MLNLWYLRRARAETRDINRRMHGLPIERVHAQSAVPLPPLRLPENWLSERRLMRMDRTMTALLILLSLCLIALAVLDTARAEEQPTPMYVTVSADSWLNGRREPDTHSSVEARFRTGDEVDVYEVDGNWAKVAGGESGYVWCQTDYLTGDQPGSAPETRTVQADGRVRVRETPDGSTVRWLRSGDTVQVQFTIGGWACIGDGYVLETYLNEVS